MFQYAIARHIAELSNTEVGLETMFYGRSRPYPYPFQLDKFFLSALNIATPGKFIYEPGLQYHPGIVDVYDENIILSGYWQDERYFKDIADLLRKDFILKPEYMSDGYHDTAEFILGFVDPVFVHVRREERANDRNAKSVHGLIGKEYYKKALRYIRRKCPNSTMLFFTDDIEYAFANYRTEGTVIPTMNDYEHFSLMTLCNHAIIANSSFSWWAAWLIQNLDKIIVAPNMWTVDPERSNKKIVPGEWKKLNPQFEI
jgi:hypothetical protein